MTNPIQLILDFQKWRKIRYNEEIACVVERIAEEHYNSNHYISEHTAFYCGILYGIEHRKEILKRVKI